jgi:colicin import membrane protein
MNTYDEPYQLPAGILAIMVHAAFFAFLYFGVNWQTLPPATMSVELWHSLPGSPAPLPEIAPSVEPVAVKPEVIEPAIEKPPELKPDIVMPDKQKPLKVKPEKKPIVKPEIKVVSKPEKKLIAKPEKMIVPQKPTQPGTARTGTAAGTAVDGTGSNDMAGSEQALQAAVKGRMVDEYKARISSKIHRNIVMPPDVANDARAEFLVTLLPGGAVLSARLLKSSGNVAYDSAVERAILKSQPLPLPADVALFNKFRELALVFKPVE